ncbi:MAG: flagellar basal body protein FliL [Treponema sp.]|jgi:flagellar basal body-associated protein FliL|nr:flagellar basal body protein FliL [Treponema sp.]
MRNSDISSANTGVASGIIWYRCLLIIAVLVALTIVSVTVYTFIARSFAKGKPVYTIPDREQPPAPPVVEDNIFFGIGRIRTFTADNQTAIVSIAFPYNREDVPFTEELVSKIIDFRNITVTYFNSQSAASVQDRGEDAVKAELLNQYNGVLKLGRIPLLYFNDFMILQ